MGRIAWYLGEYILSSHMHMQRREAIQFTLQGWNNLDGHNASMEKIQANGFAYLYPKFNHPVCIQSETVRMLKMAAGDSQ